MSNESPVIAASATVGMVGAGQLARMTHQAAIDLGIDLVVLARTPDEPAVRAGARALFGAPDSQEALCSLAEVSEVVTFDHELVPSDLIRDLAERGVCVHPSASALACAQDKLLARRRFADLGLAVPAFAELRPADPMADLERFAAQAGWPVVVKARSGGYDGRGVVVAQDAAQARAFIDRAHGMGLLAEACVDLKREVAVVGARSPSGQWVSYPLVETRQVDGICRELLMPAPVSKAAAREAERIAQTIAEGIGAVGILAVELFLTPDDRLVVNEIALRPHNSGHATIEAAATSQFENHLRAVLDWPLGDTTLRVPAAAMVNILGPADGTDPRTRLRTALSVPGVSVHLYGKSTSPGRKLGHVTALGTSGEEALLRARRSAALLSGEP